MPIYPEKTGLNIFAGLAITIGSISMTGAGEIGPAPTKNQHSIEQSQKAAFISDFLGRMASRSVMPLTIDFRSSIAANYSLEVPKAVATHISHNAEANVEASLPQILKRIGGCESAGSATKPINYHIGNFEGTSASGGFQYLDTTWDDFDGYSRAMYAPPTVQNEKAEETLSSKGPNGGTNPWVESEHCWK